MVISAKICLKYHKNQITDNDFSQLMNRRKTSYKSVTNLNHFKRGYTLHLSKVIFSVKISLFRFCIYTHIETQNQNNHFG